MLINEKNFIPGIPKEIYSHFSNDASFAIFHCRSRYIREFGDRKFSGPVPNPDLNRII